jgi:hypothetical protein
MRAGHAKLDGYKAGKTLLLNAFKLSSMAVPYLLDFGWGKNTSHRKWYKPLGPKREWA